MRTKINAALAIVLAEEPGTAVAAGVCESLSTYLLGVGVGNDRQIGDPHVGQSALRNLTVVCQY